MIFNKHVLETNVSLHLNTLMMHYINISFFLYYICHISRTIVFRIFARYSYLQIIFFVYFATSY